MTTLIVSIVLAIGVPAVAWYLKKVTARQAAALAAVLWTVAQPPYFSNWVWRSVNTDDQFLSLVLYAVAGAVVAIAAGVWAAFLPPQVRYQRLLYLAAAAGAFMAAGIWRFYLPGQVLSYAAAAVFLLLVWTPRPYEYPGYVPRRLRRRTRPS